MTFHKKYLKYKIKYLALKEKLGGRQVWAYDFDGVIHKYMKDDFFSTLHRSNNNIDIFETNYEFLIDKVFNKTIEDMRTGQMYGHKILVVSANKLKYRNSIKLLLNHFRIKIELTDIHMEVFPKSTKLRELEVNRFVDDSIINIQEIYHEYVKDKIPKLQQLIWTIPEKEKYYNIRLDMPLNLIFIHEDKPPLKHSALIESNNLPGIEDMDLLPSVV